MIVSVRKLGERVRAHRAALVRGLVRAALLVVLIVAVVQVLSPATYRVTDGVATFQLRPVAPWRGGKVVVPLGPAGVLALRTHRTPVDLHVDFRLSDQVLSLDQARSLLGGGAIKSDAAAALDSFAVSRLPWLLLAGACAGALVVGGLRPRRTFVAAAAGAAVVLLAAGAFAGLTVLTVDRHPRAEYQGLATNLPSVLRAVRVIDADSQAGGSPGLQDLVRGLQTAAGQLRTVRDAPSGRRLVRVVLASDVHDNQVGMLLLTSLVRNAPDPVAAVVLAGDLTGRGTAAEAALWKASLHTGGVPVIMVGGNHEDTPAMHAFARYGYRVLDRSSATIDGITFYGVGDPLEHSLIDSPIESSVAANAQEVLALWQGLAQPAPVLVVHEQGQAADVIAWARAHKQTLTVCYGHDHIDSVTREGTVTLVDAGTGGASGYEAIGRDPNKMYTFQVLDFSDGPSPRLLGVTTMRYSGLTGPSSAEYTPIEQ